MRRVALVTLVVSLYAQTARAQLVVIDPGNLSQAILIAVEVGGFRSEQTAADKL